MWPAGGQIPQQGSGTQKPREEEAAAQITVVVSSEINGDGVMTSEGGCIVAAECFYSSLSFRRDATLFGACVSRFPRVRLCSKTFFCLDFKSIKRLMLTGRHIDVVQTLW